jgi:hypothetical protein
VQVAGGAFVGGDRLEGVVAAQQADEDGLQHVLGVHGVAGDAVGGAEDRLVMLSENHLQRLGWLPEGSSSDCAHGHLLFVSTHRYARDR